MIRVTNVKFLSKIIQKMKKKKSRLAVLWGILLTLQDKFSGMNGKWICSFSIYGKGILKPAECNTRNKAVSISILRVVTYHSKSGIQTKLAFECWMLPKNQWFHTTWKLSRPHIASNLAKTHQVFFLKVVLLQSIMSLEKICFAWHVKFFISLARETL